MGRAYSLDLRERVVAAVAAGESCRSVAATFKVSVASVVKWSQRFRATDNEERMTVHGASGRSHNGRLWREARGLNAHPRPPPTECECLS